ncbi:MAG: alpha/beta hydrolase [Kiritimatiellae bacterium]|nr:alpha/beta hydrolase [Kiritimatiellia bacterium]
MNMKTLATMTLSIAILAAPTFAKDARKAAKPKDNRAPLPTATYDSVAYGKHKMQCIDVWLPKGAAVPTPVVIFIHGGGFRNGTRKSPSTGRYLAASQKAGVAFVSVEYRLLGDITDATPPVSACLDDIFAAVKFVQSKAKEWNLDLSRLGLMGGSAGAHSSLCVALTDNNALGVRAIFPIRPQTSMDPKEMREWIPNSRYGHALFGYKNFQEWFDHRDDCLKWIAKYSPMALLATCDPKKAPVIICEGPASPKPGVEEKDPTHSGAFIDKFKAAADKRGVLCRRGKMDDFLKELLN